MVDNDNNPFRNGEIHGDAVAGIASATADNTIGFAGIGFKCKFLPVKVANNTPQITHGYEGITYCVEQGCSIVNCSWGNKTFSQVAQDVVTWAAVNNDVVVVASAGNEDSEDMYYPASYEYVLSVTGVDASDIFEDGTNTFSRNDSVDVSAPGIDIYTTAYLGGTVYYSPPQGGTSMAAPIVSGIAGLVRSQFPCLTAHEVIEKIKSSADPIDGLALNVPYAGLIGTGRVNAEAAVAGTPCDPVGITETAESVSLTVYPNPASHELNIRMSEADNWSVSIYDTQARLVYYETVKSDRTVISNVATGFYLLQVSNDTNTFSRRISVITD
jgi:subtilisin family serine protease